MKLRCPSTSLIEAVSIVSKAVPSKTTMPILTCILIDASRGEIRLTANDMELGIETTAMGVIDEPGKIAIDARTFSDIVRKLPGFETVIEVDDNLLVTITSERAKFQIPGQDPEDFAYLPVIEKDNPVRISQFSLKEIIRQTIFSVAVNESNRLMTGELFEIKDNILRIVSLDGHRISIRRLELADECPDKKVIIPGKTLSEISKILSGDTEKMVEVYFSDNHVLFSFEQTIVLSRLIDGEYFRIDQMLSSDYETKIAVNRMEFLSAMERASLLVRESDKMPVVLDIRDEGLSLSLDTSIGSMDDAMEAAKTGRDILIGFNPKFLIDALRVIDDEEVYLYFINSKAPCFIRDEAGSYIYLILPVNISAVR